MVENVQIIQICRWDDDALPVTIVCVSANTLPIRV